MADIALTTNKTRGAGGTTTNALAPIAGLRVTITQSTSK